MINKVNISDLSGPAYRDIDLFIVCSSFEERCKSVALHMKNVPNAFVVENKNLTNYVGENASFLREFFRQSKVYDIYANTTDPIKTADYLLENLKTVIKNKDMKILVDISTFTHEHLLILFKILYLFFPENNILFVYTGADYCPKTGNPNDRWLSKGVNEIRSVLGYPGEILPSNKTHLIILVGYEHERAAKLIEMYEPDKITLGHGKKGSETTLNEGGANKYFKELVYKIGATYGEVMDFEFHCDDPQNTKTEIESNVLDSYNNIIAPMNTKLSTLGTGLVYLKNESIQICYASVLQYNYYNYSRPRDYCYIIKFKDLLN